MSFFFKTKDCYKKKKKNQFLKKQEKLQSLRKQWDTDVDGLRGMEEQTEVIKVLRKARLKLDKKAQELNADVKALHNREYWLIRRASKMNITPESDYDTSFSDITIPEKPKGRKRHQRDGRGDPIRGSDPRVLMVLSSLSNQMTHLQRKLSKIEDRREDYAGSPDPWSKLLSPRECWL